MKRECVCDTDKTNCQRQQVQPWLFKRISVAVLGTCSLLFLALQPALAAPVLTTSTGTASGGDWVLNTGIRFWFVDAKTRFGLPGPPWGPFIGPVGSPLKTKNDLGLKVNATPVITDPVSGANGYGSGFVNVTSIGIASIDYNWGVTAFATASSGPPPTGANTIAREKDPVGFNIGSAGSSLLHDITLNAGTQVQAANPQLGVTPHVMVDGRFGIGTYSDKPGLFWGDSPPPGIFDLFHISIWENASHHIDASVQFLSGDADFSLAFSHSADEIAQAIRDANWTLSGGEWKLNSDLSLVDLSITSLNEHNLGMLSTIGDMATDEAVDPAQAPEPSSLFLLGTGVLGLSGILRRRLTERS